MSTRAGVHGSHTGGAGHARGSHSRDGRSRSNSDDARSSTTWETSSVGGQKLGVGTRPHPVSCGRSRTVCTVSVYMSRSTRNSGLRCALIAKRAAGSCAPSPDDGTRGAGNLGEGSGRPGSPYWGMWLRRTCSTPDPARGRKRFDRSCVGWPRWVIEGHLSSGMGCWSAARVLP